MPGAGWIASAWNISGTISARPPKLTATAISTAIRPTFSSIFSCLFWLMGVPSGPRLGRLGCEHGLRCEAAREAPGAGDVHRHEHHAGEHQQAAAEPHEVVGIGRV